MFKFKKIFSTPLENFFYSMNFLRSLSSKVGMDIGDPLFGVNKRNFSLIMYLCFYFVRATWCVYEVRDSFSKIILTFTTVGYAGIGVTKLITAFKKFRLIANLYHFIKHIYEANQKNNHVHGTLHYFGYISTFIIAVTFAIYVIGSLVFTTLPIVSYILYNRYELIHHIKFPGVSIESTYGYAYNILFQVMDITFGTIGNFVADGIFFLFINYSLCMVRVIEHAFEELERAIKLKANDAELNKMLINIIRMHQEYELYIKQVNGTYGPIIFAEIGASAFFIGLTMFCVVTEDYISGYGLVLLYVGQLLTFCFVGTVIDTNNDRLRIVIYNSAWHQLPLREQKLILFMLLKANQAGQLKLNVIGLVHLELGTEVLKMNYSFYMMVREMVLQ